MRAIILIDDVCFKTDRAQIETWSSRAGTSNPAGIKTTGKIKQFKSDSDFTTAKSLMCALPVHNMAGREISLRSVDNLRLLCKKGITIRKTIDVLIALTVLKIS